MAVYKVKRISSQTKKIPRPKPIKKPKPVAPKISIPTTITRTPFPVRRFDKVRTKATEQNVTNGNGNVPKGNLLGVFRSRKITRPISVKIRKEIDKIKIPKWL